MNVNRLRGVADVDAQPRPEAAVAPPAGFILVPATVIAAATLAHLLWLEQLYQWALEQARAAARPSLYEQALEPKWN
jgi:hypothetical protein